MSNLGQNYKNINDVKAFTEQMNLHVANSLEKNKRPAAELVSVRLM
jgi:hypothetical protein